MNTLITTLKSQIIEALNLEEISPEDINENDPLFGEGLGLDSIDALEIILLLEKEYGIRFSDPSEAKAVFQSIQTIAVYITQHKAS